MAPPPVPRVSPPPTPAPPVPAAPSAPPAPRISRPRTPASPSALPQGTAPRSSGKPDTLAATTTPRDTRAPLPNGTTLRHYTITGRLGAGGYGLTYRARHTTKGYAVVIKEHMPLGMAMREPGSSEVAFPSPQEEERFRATMAEFVEEITVLRALEYPGIVPIIDSFEANDTAYYVMPFIPGTTLHTPEKSTLDSHLQRRQARRIRSQLHSLLCTLEYMEQHHIVHRDIKPDNILLAAGENPVLLDFGSARQLQAGKVFTNVFTPTFCAPEQATASSDRAMCENLGPWTDIYALGATFYYLISHLMPPGAEARVYSTPDPYKPLASRPDLCSIYGTEFLAAIDRALELTPSDRWQSAATWRLSMEEDSYEIPPKVMRHIRIFSSIALLVLLVVGGLAIYAFSERSQVSTAYNCGLNFTESILHDFSTELTDLPGSAHLQRHLSANLQKYLATMRDLPIGRDGRLDRSMAAAWFNIGCMHLSLGNLQEARSSLLRAQELESMICRKAPDDQRFHFGLARTYLALAELENRCNRSAESAAHASAAVGILEKLFADFPDNPDYGSSLGEALAFESFYLRKQGNHEARKQVLDRLLPLYRSLVAEFPRHTDSVRGLAQALHYHGRYAKDMELYERAHKYLTESRKIFSRLTENYPSHLSLKKGMAEVLRTMGDMYYYQSLREDDPQAKELYGSRAADTLREHISLVRELRRLDSNNPDYLLLECRALEQVGNIQLLRGRVNEAEAQMRTILERVELLLLKEPDNSNYISTKALALCSLALAHHYMPRHYAKAPEEMAQSRRLLEAHIRKFQNPPVIILSTLMEVLTHSAGIALQHGERELALSWLEQADSMLNELTRDTPQPTSRQKVYRSFIRTLLQSARTNTPPPTLLHAPDAG